MKRPMECCGKAAAFVQRLRLAVKGHNEAVGAARTNCLARRGVMLPCGQSYGVLRQSRSFRAATTFGDKGP